MSQLARCTRKVLATLIYEHELLLDVEPEDDRESIETKLLDTARTLRTIGPGDLRDWKWEAVPAYLSSAESKDAEET